MEIVQRKYKKKMQCERRKCTKEKERDSHEENKKKKLEEGVPNSMQAEEVRENPQMNQK